jgi:hypothetical protein
MQLIVMVAGLVAGVSVWAYSTFETEEHAEQQKTTIERRLERIENKVDELLRRSSGP